MEGGVVLAAEGTGETNDIRRLELRGGGDQANLTSELAITNLVVANVGRREAHGTPNLLRGTAKWWTLGAVSFGLFMIMLDNTVVNVALPAIQKDLGADLSELQWIVAGYALSFAALMLIGGKLADAFGRRLIFVVGIVIFTLASLCVRPRRHRRDADRGAVVQGAGAALMNPATLSIIAATFPPKQRGTAIGIWAGVSALALAIGPLVGGLLTEHLSWHWIFFINVPVGVIAIAASFMLITESRDDDARRASTCPGSALGARALRPHVRPDRGEHLRLDIGADRRLVRPRRGRARVVRA